MKEIFSFFGTNRWGMSCWLVLIVLGLFSGCATFHPHPIDPQHVEAKLRERTLTDPGLRAYVEAAVPGKLSEWPPQVWDLTLLTLVALYYHPDLDVARAMWEIAEAGVVTARGRPNPSVELAPGYASNSVPGITPWLLNSPVDIPIETAGKRGYRILHATHLSEAVRLTIAVTAWQVRSGVRKSLLALYAAAQTEARLSRQQEVREDIVTVMEQRLAAGEIALPEVTLVRIALDQTWLSLRDVQRQRAEARVQVADALGVPVEVLHSVTLSFDSFAHSPPQLPAQEVQRQTLLSRPDILATLAEYAASESALQLEIAKQYPDLHLGPGYDLDTGDNKWSLGFSLVLPVLNRNEGPIAEAEARRRETAARFTALQARVIGELDRTLAGYQAALQKLATADTLLSAHTEQQESQQALFAAGEADRFALFNARLEYEVSALSRFNALVQAQQALGLLEDAVQRPLSPPGSLPLVPETRPRVEEESNR